MYDQPNFSVGYHFRVMLLRFFLWVSMGTRRHAALINALRSHVWLIKANNLYFLGAMWRRPFYVVDE